MRLKSKSNFERIDAHAKRLRLIQLAFVSLFWVRCCCRSEECMRRREQQSEFAPINHLMMLSPDLFHPMVPPTFANLFLFRLPQFVAFYSLARSKLRRMCASVSPSSLSINCSASFLCNFRPKREMERRKNCYNLSVDMLLREKIYLSHPVQITSAAVVFHSSLASILYG